MPDLDPFPVPAPLTPAERLADLNRSIALFPQDGINFHLRAHVYEELADPKAALPDFHRAIYLQPHHARHYHCRGYFYLTDTGNYGAAMADLNRAISLDPTHGDSYFWRSYLHRMSGDDEAAAADLAALKRVLRVDPLLGPFDPAIWLDLSSPSAQYNLARLSARCEEPDEALAQLYRALDAAPGRTLRRLRTDPHFDPLRFDPRFWGLVAEFEGRG